MPHDVAEKTVVLHLLNGSLDLELWALIGWADAPSKKSV
jgi:hypothetical protein